MNFADKTNAYAAMDRELFLVDNFSREASLFPNQVFARSWDYVGFFTFNDWFHSEAEYEALQHFLRDTGSDHFISSAPPIYGVPALEVSSTTSREAYNNDHALGVSSADQDGGMGLRQHPEIFYYDRSRNWAILASLTNDLMICGMDRSVKPSFVEAFGDIRDVRALLDYWVLNETPIVDHQREMLIRNYQTVKF